MLFILSSPSYFCTTFLNINKLNHTVMKLVVFFIMVVLCIAGSIFTAFDKMRRLKGVEGKKNQRLRMREIKDIVTE